MSNHTIVFTLSVVLWLFLAYRFIRAVRNRKVSDGASLHAWAIFFLVYLIALLTVDSIGAWIDGHFGELPVTTLTRSLLMLLTVIVFFLGIERVYARRPSTAKTLMRLTVADAGICIGLFVWFASNRLISTDAMVYLVKDVRDVIMIAWTVLIFIPFSVHLWQSEQVRPMKLHRAIDLVFWAAFLTESITGITLSLAVLLAARWEPYISAVDRSATYLCYLLMLITLFPYRWLMPLFYPRKLLLYLRLKRLQRTVKRWAGTQPPLPDLSLKLTHPDEIELAIYQTLITILDMYPSMSESGRALQKKIQQVVDTQPPYLELVQKMASLRA